MNLADFQMLETETPKGVQTVLDFGEYTLSIVRNEFSYGNKQGLFEIAVYKNDKPCELVGITATDETVKGWLTANEVNAIIKKMYTLTMVIPTQV